MITPISDTLNQILFDHPPKSILCIGDGVHDALKDFLAKYPQCTVLEVNIFQLKNCQMDLTKIIDWQDHKSNYDFGIIANTIEHLEKNDADHLLAQLRDLYSKKLLVVVPIGDQWHDHQSTWQNIDLLALGFVNKTKIRIAQKPVHIYAFDIASYKTTPDWLNNKYWANPELWDKYWW